MDWMQSGQNREPSGSDDWGEYSASQVPGDDRGEDVEFSDFVAAAPSVNITNGLSQTASHFDVFEDAFSELAAGLPEKPVIPLDQFVPSVISLEYDGDNVEQNGVITEVEQAGKVRLESYDWGDFEQPSLSIEQRLPSPGPIATQRTPSSPLPSPRNIPSPSPRQILSPQPIIAPSIQPEAPEGDFHSDVSRDVVDQEPEQKVEELTRNEIEEATVETNTAIDGEAFPDSQYEGMGAAGNQGRVGLETRSPDDYYDAFSELTPPPSPPVVSLLPPSPINSVMDSQSQEKVVPTVDNTIVSSETIGATSPPPAISQDAPVVDFPRGVHDDIPVALDSVVATEREEEDDDVFGEFASEPVAVLDAGVGIIDLSMDSAADQEAAVPDLPEVEPEVALPSPRASATEVEVISVENDYAIDDEDDSWGDFDAAHSPTSPIPAHNGDVQLPHGDVPIHIDSSAPSSEAIASETSIGNIVRQSSGDIQHPAPDNDWGNFDNFEVTGAAGSVHNPVQNDEMEAARLALLTKALKVFSRFGVYGTDLAQQQKLHHTLEVEDPTNENTATEDLTNEKAPQKSEKWLTTDLSVLLPSRSIVVAAGCMLNPWIIRRILDGIPPVSDGKGMGEEEEEGHLHSGGIKLWSPTQSCGDLASLSGGDYTDSKRQSIASIASAVSGDEEQDGEFAVEGPGVDFGFLPPQLTIASSTTAVAPPAVSPSPRTGGLPSLFSLVGSYRGAEGEEGEGKSSDIIVSNPVLQRDGSVEGVPEFQLPTPPVNSQSESTELAQIPQTTLPSGPPIHDESDPLSIMATIRRLSAGKTPTASAIAANSLTWSTAESIAEGTETNMSGFGNIMLIERSNSMGGVGQQGADEIDDDPFAAIDDAYIHTSTETHAHSGGMSDIDSAHVPRSSSPPATARIKDSVRNEAEGSDSLEKEEREISQEERPGVESESEVEVDLVSPKIPAAVVSDAPPDEDEWQTFSDFQEAGE